MPNNFPKISIGITCFNAETTILRAVSSAINQSWPNKEIIVVDDCSNDESFYLLQELCLDHPEIKLVRHVKNGGFPSALNSILRVATGEFIAFFDDDDVSKPHRLTAQFNRIRSYENTHNTRNVLCYSNRDVVRANEAFPSHITLAIGRTQPEPYGEMVANYLFTLVGPYPFTWGQFGSCTLMARVSLFTTLEGFDTEFRRCAEWDLAVRAAFLGAHFIAVNESLITQNLTMGVGLEKTGKTPLKFAVQLRRKHKKFLLSRGIYFASLAQAYARYHYSRREFWRHRFYTLLACALAPRFVAPSIIGKIFKPAS